MIRNLSKTNLRSNSFCFLCGTRILEEIGDVRTQAIQNCFYLINIIQRDLAIQNYFNFLEKQKHKLRIIALTWSEDQQN